MSATDRSPDQKEKDMRKALGSVVSLLFVASGLALVGPPGTALASCEEGASLPSFTIRMRAEESRYRLGDTARVHVKVTREIEGRVLGPAEGAQITLGLLSKGTYLYGGAVADADGKALVKIRIARYARLGLADAYAVATKKVVNGPCLRIRESGYQEQKGFLKIVR
jgi:hypothetical protein